MLTILIILLVVSVLFGGWGMATNNGFGYASWSPLGIVLVIVLVMWLTGSLTGTPGLRFR